MGDKTDSKTSEKTGSPREGKSLPINEWDEADRPREKMLQNGKKSLSNSELIAILLRTGVKGTNALELAKRLLQTTDGRLTGLARLEIWDLQKLGGLGTAKAATVLAALELGNRMLGEQRIEKADYALSAVDLFKIISPKLIDLPHEEFWAIFLSTRNKVLWKQRISMGGLTQTSADLRILFRTAIEHNAVGLAVVHNHPSGILTPSRLDKELTQRIKCAGEILNIRLIDHLIVGVRPSGEPDYFSFSENEML